MLRKLKLSSKAQHVIEFSVLIVAVVLSIIVMRNYVLRSVFAHLKMWEDETNASLGPTSSCALAGGTEVVVGAVTICRFIEPTSCETNPCCPPGWTQYLHWTTTAVGVWGGYDCDMNWDECSTSNHPWGNIDPATEHCDFWQCDLFSCPGSCWWLRGYSLIKEIGCIK